METAPQVGDADAAAGQDGVFTGKAHIKAVAKATQNVQLCAGHAAHEFFGALAHHLDQQHQGVVGPVADGDGAAQEFSGQFDVHELARRRDGGGVAGEDQLVGILRQLPGVFHGKERFFHKASSWVFRS